MSVSIMSAVFKHSKATLGSRLVLLAIADCANDDALAWPNVKTLAGKCRLSERETQYCLRKLEELGELKITARKKENGGWQSSLYEILVQNLHPPSAISAPPSRKDCTTLVQPIAPESSIEPSENHQIHSPYPLNGNAKPNLPQPTRSARRRFAPVPVPSEEFLNFWDEYPRKQAMKPAWAAWQKIKQPAPVTEILEAVKLQKRKLWKHCEIHHIPLAATWINAERWDDEL